ncbi:hypothetical protein [Campylobacter sp. RM16188]|uniref:hypothetical protein n=1 Tax=Campylobacter sp. RM16188 TaxID=1705725 RepID=UPI001554F1A7|nr:hypothetical protein [Campylobacter sp. RM16188]
MENRTNLTRIEKVEKIKSASNKLLDFILKTEVLSPKEKAEFKDNISQFLIDVEKVSVEEKDTTARENSDVMLNLIMADLRIKAQKINCPLTI